MYSLVKLESKCLQLYILGYKWADKSSVNYLNWGLNQPDNFLGIENCVEMNPSTSTWNDVSCFATRNWICAIKRGKNIVFVLIGVNLMSIFLLNSCCLQNDETLGIYVWFYKYKTYI